MEKRPSGQSVVFTDDSSYSNMTLIYIPPRTTSRLQALDMGFFNFCQARYRLWLNKQLFDKKTPSKLESVNKVYELLRSVPVECGIKSLAPICVEYFHWKIGGRVNLDNFVQLYLTKIEMKKTFYEKHWFLLIVHDEIDQMLTPCKKGLESVRNVF